MGLKEFKEKLLSDKEYAKKYADVKTPEEVVEIASKDGYTFTAEDVKNDTELTDTELEAAAGGGITADGEMKSVTILAKGYFVTK